MSGDLPPVRIHALLQHRGGATGIARAVFEGCVREGGDCAFSHELAEGEGDGDELVSASEVGAWVARTPGALAHVHGSLDWEACLGGLSGHAPLVVTLHDCGLLTGGCPYPLDCDQWSAGCAHCERNFPASAERRAARREAVRLARPVLVSPSRWLANMAREALPDADVRVIPNGVPWPEHLPAKVEARREIGLAPGVKLVLFAAHGGRDAAYKAGDKWEALWQRIKLAVPEAVCFMVGGEVHERRGDLFLWPYVDGETMLRFMRAADVLAYPTMADNHSLVVLEAMSMELPCVAFGVGGIPEQIVSGETGIVVAPGQWEAMESAVVRVLRDPGLGRRMGREAFERGRMRFSRERMVADHLRLYRRLSQRERELRG
ncbi:glycosyltransferase involved in cell wall biosynthesis [Desulfobaculum xiamenense]|uniref:Glycosyltransferase involved in cell wall biosynthesis n=1 Tax=Desulfobaculum xiamenense TaxID=995050 RepID=A0A846QNY0_9BACT|nr:glycosyltransferase [Desulfobaculum xiamenense]NJB66924.1 glycosyltransferase involved in cell wall biosynthesis [Desulfobaculum xiamenense]